MKKVQNKSPLGDVHVPVLDRDVAFNEVVSVEDDIAASLLLQTVNWVSADSVSTPPTPTASDVPAVSETN